MWWTITTQIPGPEVATSWTEAIKEGGPILLLALFVVAIVRKWFAPWYVVTMLENQCAALKAERDELLELALRTAATSETAVSVLKQRR
jgi:hypothetical protein